ncbi:kinase-like protein [Heliocybe sulcata]|uniref:Kinase-like protein n=1 Tax=Heliocybe sulcata TaxID=5364 RepID=A0A5C3MPW6_9AGAM|nr:kinase-like protein [Heliocybe sulcata]
MVQSQCCAVRVDRRRKSLLSVAYCEEDGSELGFDNTPIFSKLESNSHLARYKDQVVLIRFWRMRRNDYRSAESLRMLNREANEWKQLHHHNLAEFIGLADTACLMPGIISPFYKNGDILAYTARNKKADILLLLRGVASAVSYLHNRKIPAVHGNIKASNILITDAGEAVLTDYGMSRVADFAIHFTRPSANIFEEARWQAPELLNGAFTNDERWGATPATDTYSFGMTCLEVCTGRTPFSNRRFNVQDLLEVSHGARPDRPDEQTYPLISDEMWDMMQSCWQQQPESRPTMDVVEQWIGLIRTLRDIESMSG